MFDFFGFIFNLLSGIADFIISYLSGTFRIFGFLDDLYATALNAINAMPDVFVNYASLSLSLILACGIVRFFT